MIDDALTMLLFQREGQTVVDEAWPRRGAPLEPFARPYEYPFVDNIHCIKERVDQTLLPAQAEATTHVCD